MTKPKAYASVWDALADTPEQAANLRARAELMQKIAAIVKKHRWTQTEAAKRCGVSTIYFAGGFRDFRSMRWSTSPPAWAAAYAWRSKRPESHSNAIQFQQAIPKEAA